MKRLRIFAGPNGSGKSTLCRRLEGQFRLGSYINADDLLKQISASRILEFDSFGVIIAQEEWCAFWQNHGLNANAPGLAGSYVERNILVFKQSPKSYETAVLADFIRHVLLRKGESFSFETVFSHSSKLEFIELAKEFGYKIYLYFSTVSSLEISVARIQQRVLEGGHDVPADKVRARYLRVMENLLPAIRLAHRAYLFDNSQEMELVAEVTPEQNLMIRTERVPLWLEEYVLERF